MIQRLVSAIPTLAGVLTVTFILMRVLPGDPAAFSAGPAATPEAIQEIRRNLGLDRNIVWQFGSYLAGLSRGDLGMSLSTGRPVRTELVSRLPASLELTCVGLAFAICIGLPLGCLAASRPDTWIDHACRFLATAGVCLPSFFVGLLLIYVFYFCLGWAPPPFGRLDPFTEPPPLRTGFLLVDSLLAGNLHLFGESLSLLALPATTLGLFAAAPLARLTRASFLGVLSSDYLRTARAMGLSPSKILLVYAGRNALPAVLTSAGMVFSYLLGINVLVEKVFAWPGVGSYALEALLVSDYAPVQGYVLTLAVLYTGVNLVVDLAQGVVDPRLRVRRVA